MRELRYRQLEFRQFSFHNSVSIIGVGGWWSIPLPNPKTLHLPSTPLNLEIEIIENLESGSYRYPKEARLRKPVEFARVYNGNIYAADEMLVMQAAPNSGSRSRLGRECFS